MGGGGRGWSWDCGGVNDEGRGDADGHCGQVGDGCCTVGGQSCGDWVGGNGRGSKGSGYVSDGYYGHGRWGLAGDKGGCAGLRRKCQ